MDNLDLRRHAALIGIDGGDRGNVRPVFFPVGAGVSSST
jgi:hypothetical protein